MESSHSHYKELLKIILEQARLYPEGIPTSTIESLMPRGNGSNIFGEGDQFSGNIIIGPAETSLTVVPSPHVAATIPTDKFLERSTVLFERKVVLPPDMQHVRSIAPHLAVWWRMNRPGEIRKFDIFDLFHANISLRNNFTQAIETQTIRALNILDGNQGLPVIYGTWGYATSQEVIEAGLSRGAPTMPDGHIHIAIINEKDQKISYRNRIEPSAQLHHYSPWNHIINNRFGTEIAYVLQNIVNQIEGHNSSSEVKFRKGKKKHLDGRISSYEGYEISFSSPQSFGQALNYVINIAGSIEDFYQIFLQEYSEFHKNNKAPNIRQELEQQILSFGIREPFAKKLTDFILSISPTYGQMMRWKTELESNEQSSIKNGFLESFVIYQKKRNRFIQHILQRDSQPLRKAFIYDTYVDPSPYNDHIWPLHFNAYYLFDDFAIDNNRLEINKVTLLPSILNKTGIPERVLGVRLARDTGYNKT